MGQAGMHKMSVGWVLGSRYPGILSPRGRQHGGVPCQGRGLRLCVLCPGQRGCHGEGSILAPMLTSWVPLRKALALQATILSSVQWVASPLPARPRVRIQ